MSVSTAPSGCFPVRYLALILILLYSIGIMTINDSPSALQHVITSSLNLNTYQYSLMFSLAVWPSCFGFINGYIIDRFLGIRVACLLFSTLLTAGNVLFLIGSFLCNFDLLVVGRILYGLGADPMMLCMNAFVLHWFQSTNELSMAFAMITSIPWIGSSSVFFTSNRFYQYLRAYYPPNQSLGLSVSASMSFTIVMAFCCLLLTLMYRPPSNSQLQNATGKNQLEKDKKSWTATIKFPIAFWTLTILINLYFLGIMTFLMFSQEFFHTRYNMTLDAASNMASAFSLITCVLSSPMGFLIDRLGRNLLFISISLCLALLAHGMMAFTTSNPFAAVIILSVSFTMMTASYLPLIGHLVHKHQTATAYGVAQSGMNLAFAAGSLISGRIITSYGYNAIEKFYFTVIACTVPVWLMVWMVDIYQGNKLNMTPDKKLYLASDLINIKSTELKGRTLTADPLGKSTPPTLRKELKESTPIYNK